jgi:hypothetical protein
MINFFLCSCIIPISDIYNAITNKYKPNSTYVSYSRNHQANLSGMVL